jgi:hypothetical protein
MLHSCDYLLWHIPVTVAEPAPSYLTNSRHLSYSEQLKACKCKSVLTPDAQLSISLIGCNIWMIDVPLLAIQTETQPLQQ